LRVADLGFGVLGLGFRVEGWGLRATRDEDQGFGVVLGSRMKGEGPGVRVER